MRFSQTMGLLLPGIGKRQSVGKTKAHKRPAPKSLIFLLPVT